MRSTVVPYHQIRATFNDESIIVYQAYNPSIAEAAIRAQTLDVPEFKQDRMTWIKPSFRWMLYRSGWARKANQERILAIHLTRTGFEQALKWSGTREEGASVRIQWDPERDMEFKPLGWRSIQIGLSGEAVKNGLLKGWILRIEDYTEVATKIGELVDLGQLDAAERLLPAESPYVFLEESTRIACQAD
jgi:Domain of unknown function (DUF4291)